MDKKTIDLKFWIFVIFSIIAGGAIAWIDSSPGWDDTGITVGMLLITSALTGFVYQKKLWLWALLIGMFIPLLAIIRTGDFKFLLILLITFAGSYGGGLLRRAFKN
jgi:hypothetical protein